MPEVKQITACFGSRPVAKGIAAGVVNNVDFRSRNAGGNAKVFHYIVELLICGPVPPPALLETAKSYGVRRNNRKNSAEQQLKITATNTKLRYFGKTWAISIQSRNHDQKS